MSSIFTKILEWEIPWEIIYQNETVFVIKDIIPEEKTHFLIIPKEEIASISDLDSSSISIIWEMHLVAQIVADTFGIKKGYKLRINVWDYQEIPHIHMHLLSKY